MSEPDPPGGPRRPDDNPRRRASTGLQVQRLGDVSLPEQAPVPMPPPKREPSTVAVPWPAGRGPDPDVSGSRSRPRPEPDVSGSRSRPPAYEPLDPPMPAPDVSGSRTRPRPPPTVSLDPAMPAPAKKKKKKGELSVDVIGGDLSAGRAPVFLAVALAVVVVVVALLASGDSGQGGGVYSDSEVAQISEQGRGQVLKGWQGALDDAALQAEVQKIASQVASAVPGSRGDFKVYVAKDSLGAHAVMLPNGDVIVSVGLLQRLNAESQLAGLLAHLAAHGALGHHAHALDEREDLAPFVRAALESETDKKAILELIGVVSMTPQSALLESAADDLALRALKSTNFDPHGVLEGLRRLSLPGGPRATYLTQHPLTPDREKALTQRAGDNPGRLGAEEYAANISARLGAHKAPVAAKAPTPAP